MLDGIQPSGGYTANHTQVVERASAAIEVEIAPASDTAKAKSPASSAIYFSPSMQIDHEASMAIFVVRNSETGAVINQYPSKKVVEEYKRSDTKKVEAPQPKETPEAAAATTVPVKTTPPEDKPAVVAEKAPEPAPQVTEDA